MYTVLCKKYVGSQLCLFLMFKRGKYFQIMRTKNLNFKNTNKCAVYMYINLQPSVADKKLDSFLMIIIFIRVFSNHPGKWESWALHISK